MDTAADPAAFHLRISLLQHAVKQAHYFMNLEPVWDAQIMQGYQKALSVLAGAAKLCAKEEPREVLSQARVQIKEARDALRACPPGQEACDAARAKAQHALMEADVLIEHSLLENVMRAPELKEQLYAIDGERLQWLQRGVPPSIDLTFQESVTHLLKTNTDWNGNNYQLSAAYTALLAFDALAVYLPEERLQKNSNLLLTLTNNTWRGLAPEWQNKSAIPNWEFGERYTHMVGSTIALRLHKKVLNDFDAHDWSRGLRDYALARPADSVTVKYARGVAAEAKVAV